MATLALQVRHLFLIYSLVQIKLNNNFFYLKELLEIY